MLAIQVDNSVIHSDRDDMELLQGSLTNTSQVSRSKKVKFSHKEKLKPAEPNRPQNSPMPENQNQPSQEIESFHISQSQGQFDQQIGTFYESRQNIFEKETMRVLKDSQLIQQEESQKVGYCKKLNELIKIYSLGKNPYLQPSSGSLKRQETEATSYKKRWKLLIIFAAIIAIFYAFVNFINSKFLLLGSEKSQTVTTEYPDTHEFDTEKQPIKKIVDITLVVDYNQAEITDRMECLLKQDQQKCFEISEKQCSSSFKDPRQKDFQGCMFGVFMSYGRTKLEFCDQLYFNSQAYTPLERSSEEFFEQYHDCRKDAGQPRGQKYCDDVIGTRENFANSELYACYEETGVDVQLYGENKCLYENPLECVNDLSFADSYGDDCDKYVGNSHWCGMYDTDDFKSNVMCCECKVHRPPDEVVEQYKDCLKNIGLEKVAQRYECDYMEQTYDQYEFRKKCWDDQVQRGVEVPNLNSIFDQVYARDRELVGKFSFHFHLDQIGNDHSFCSSEAYEQYYDDGSRIPDKLYFENQNYDPEQRKYSADIFFNESNVSGAAKWEFEMIFSDDFMVIESGFWNDIDIEGNKTYNRTFQVNRFYSNIAGYCYKIRETIKLRDTCYRNLTDENLYSNQTEDQQLTAESTNPVSLGHCETLLLLNNRTQSFWNASLDCIRNLKLPLYVSQMCGCESNGRDGKYCNFLACEKGTCQTCSNLDSPEDCENTEQELPSAGISDCKLRCFGILQQSSGNCGQNYTNFTLNSEELPEKEKYLICDKLYPDSNKWISSTERTECLLYFNLISEEEIYQTCFNEEIKKSGIDDYNECYDGFESEPKDDKCLILSSWHNIDGQINYSNKYGSLEYCLNTSYYPKSAEFCLHTYRFETGKTDLRGIKRCLEAFDLPISQEDKCYFDHFPIYYANDDDYIQLITAADSNCANDETFICRYCKDIDKKMYDEEILYNKRNDKFWKGKDLVKVVDDIINENPQCAKNPLAFWNYFNCLYNITENFQLLPELNKMLSAKNESNGYAFVPITKEHQYCDQVFKQDDMIDSKLVCYAMIKLPAGPERCFKHLRVTDEENFQFNLYWKYLCLSSEGVSLDLIPSKCLKDNIVDDKGTIQQKKIFAINDCLKIYEESGSKPQLTKQGSEYYYLRGLGTEETEQVNDLHMTSKFDPQEIIQFICENNTEAHFISAPYKVFDQSNDLQEMDKVSFKLSCDIIQYQNQTNKNLAVIYRLTNESIPVASGEIYSEDFSKQKLVFNRTNFNQQQFKYQISDELDLIQVQSVRMFKRDSSEPVEQFKNHDDLTKFMSSPKTIQVFQTDPYIISEELIPTKSVKVESTLSYQVQHNATSLLDYILPQLRRDINTTKFEFSKIIDVIKPIAKETLKKDQLLKINQIKLLLDISFQLIVVKKEYYTHMDIIQELGGIGGSVLTAMKALGGVSALIFSINFARMIQRKYSHEFNLKQIKQLKKLLPGIKSKVIYELEDRSLREDNKKQLQMDLNQIDVFLGDKTLKPEQQEKNITQSLYAFFITEKEEAESYDQNYDLTNDRLKQIQQLVKKYMPEFAEPEKLFALQRAQNTNDEFELIEIEENELKHEMFKQKTNLTLSRILQDSQDRLSFFRIYKLTNTIEHLKLVAKKVKNMLKIERRQRQEEISALKQEISALKQQDPAPKEEDSALKEEVSALKQEISALKQQDPAPKEEDSAMKEEVSALKSELNSEKAKRQEIEQEMSVMQEQMKQQMSVMQEQMKQILVSNKFTANKKQKLK